MRITTVSLALLLATPALVAAQERTRPPPPSNQSAPAARSEPPEPALAAPDRPPRPPPPDTVGTRPPPPPPSSVRPRPGQGPWGPPPVYYPPPFWWGFGWGYGYYPLYPLYGEPQPAYDVGPAHHPRYVDATMRATGAFGNGDSGAVGLAFAVDSRRGGFDMAFDAFAPSRGGVMVGGLNGSQDAYGFGSAHVAFPILEGPAYRLRLQAGGSWLTVPASSGFGSSTDAFGLDVGASATLGLIGPLGLEGHAHITPFPVRVIDLRAAVALRAGSFSLLGGYRVLDVAEDSRTGPAARFEGPEIGFGLIF